ncbi:TPA: hypothetical protein N0F65_008026 [Lagenidium giganteum]|uniref:Uncharacterized protein n=1 Tax=Lagenidium giganteum TaxID=4803 RepID=A0AAV2YIS0_9STRA|nr:TPA: hypothetical protein N0F65_008026 [Lagenidium giganteum]
MACCLQSKGCRWHREQVLRASCSGTRYHRDSDAVVPVLSKELVAFPCVDPALV